MNSSKQSGFSVIEIILVVVVVGLLGLLGWTAYNSFVSKPAAKVNTQTTNQNTNQATNNSTNQSTPPAETTTSTVVKIPELGIQITVPNDIKDLKYQVSTGTLPNGNQEAIALFSTATLIQLDPNCGTSFGPLGSLSRANGQYPGGDHPTIDYGPLLVQFPTFYISNGEPNAVCSTNAPNDATNTAASKYRSEFETAETTIQQLNQ